MTRFDGRRYLRLDDFASAARRILPHGLYGFIAGHAEDGASGRANAAAFDDWSFVPRALVDTSARSLATSFVDRTWSAPFGIAPMGAAGVAAFRADLVLASAAARCGVPFVLSTSSLVSMERVIAVNADAWFQLYASAAEAENDALIGRIANAGYRTLVVTVDVPVGGNREDDRRNGYSSPLKPTWRLCSRAVARPRWAFGCLARTLLLEGMPRFVNLPGESVPMISRRATRGHRRDGLVWFDVERLRDRWPGRLVLKGLLAAHDVGRAASLGIDAVIVSNHGGRQLDGAIAPLRALPALVEAAGAMPLAVDGAVRRGTHVLKIVGLGGAFAFVGRPILYAAIVGGEAGVIHALTLLADEVGRDLALLGATTPGDAVGRVVHQRLVGERVEAV